MAATTRLSAAERKARKDRARYLIRDVNKTVNRDNPRLAILERISAGTPTSTWRETQGRVTTTFVATFPGAIHDPDADIFIDEDVTGGGTKVRDALEDLMDQVRAGRYDGVVVSSWDRFFRTVLLTAKVVADMKEAGCELYIVDQPGLSLYDMAGNFRLQALAEAAELELAAIKRRTKNGHATRAAHGIVRINVRTLYGTRTFSAPSCIPGRVADVQFLEPDDDLFELLEHDPDYSDGFDKTWTAPATKADVVRWVGDRVAEGSFRAALATTLNRRGIPAPAATGWSQVNIKNLLGNVRLIGQVTHHGELLLDEDGLPKRVNRPVLDDSVFYACRAQMATGDFTPRKEYTDAWLVGAVRCDSCGSSMSWNGNSSYVCQAKYRTPGADRCPGNTINRLYLERDIDAVMRELLADPERMVAARSLNNSAATRRRDEAIAADVARVNKKVSDLQRMKLDGDFSDDQGPARYKEFLAGYQAELRKLNTERQPTLQRLAVDLGEDPVAFWDAAGPADRRLVVAEFIAAIKVKPLGKRTNRYVPGRWRIVARGEADAASTEAA